MSNKTPKQPPPIDLSQYSTVNEALSAAADVAARFSKVAKRALTENNPSKIITLGHLFLWAALGRARGLHDGITREIRAANPHAVFPLLRTYVELAGQLNYIAEKPSYLTKLLANPRDSPMGRGRVTFQAIWAVARGRYPGIGFVYEELSEFGHFGSSGVFASVRFDSTLKTDTSPGTLSQWIGPGWRDPDHDPKLAAAWLFQANDMTLREATRFLETHLVALVPGLGEKAQDASQPPS